MISKQEKTIAALKSAWIVAYNAGMKGGPCPCMADTPEVIGHPISETFAKAIRLFNKTLRDEYNRGVQDRTK